MHKFDKYLRLFMVAFVVLVLDQLTKFLVLINIEPGTYIYPPAIPLIDNFLYIVHIYNTGAAWGVFAGGSLWLALLAIVALVLLFVFRKKLELERTIMQYIVGLLLGGIVGNLIDRLLHGHVIDFIDVHLPGYRFPSFNVADIALSVSVALYIIIAVLDSLKKEPSN